MVLRDLLFRLGFKVRKDTIRQAERGVDRVKGKAKGAQGAIAGMSQNLMGMFGIIGGAVALMGLGKAVVGTVASFETLRTGLISVTGSAEAADKAFNKIREFAKVTPFQVEEVAGAFRKLSVRGLNPSERALTSYGDTASAMGKSLDQMVEAVADATMGEFERLKEFGIKAKKQGNFVEFTFDGVTTKVKNDSKEIEGYLIGLGETKFAGGMERQSKTLAGMWSTLKDAAAGFIFEIGEGGLLDGLRELMQVFMQAGVGGKSLAHVLGFVLGTILHNLVILLNAAISVGKTLKEVFMSLIPRQLLDDSDGLLTKIKDIVKNVILFTNPIALLFLLIEDFIAFLQGRKSVIGEFVGQFVEMDGVLGTIARALVAIKDPKTWQKLSALASKAFQAIGKRVEKLRGLWNRFLDLMKIGWDRTVQFARPVLESIARLIGRVKEAWGEVREKLEPLFDSMQRLFNVVSSLTKKALAFWEAWQKSDEVQAVVDFLAKVWAVMIADAERALGVVIDVIGEIFGWILESITATFDETAKFFEKIDTFLTDLPKNAQKAWENFLKFVEASMNVSIAAVNEIIDTFNIVSPVEIERIARVSLSGEGRNMTSGMAPASTVAGGFGNVSGTIGSVNVTIEGSTNMGPDEIRKATEGGVADGFAKGWADIERGSAVGTR